MPTAQIVTIIHKTGLNIDESEVLVLPVHSRETRLVSFETRLISFLSRRISRETRRVSRDGGNLLLSGTVDWGLLNRGDSNYLHTRASCTRKLLTYE